MMKLSLPIIASLALVAGCKTDKAESTSESSATPTESSTHAGRSGKIDLPRRTKPSLDGDEAQPAPPDDESMSREERKARREERRKEREAEMDTDKDGKVSPEELAAARSIRMDAMKKRFDVDGDGKLTVAELEKSPMAARMGDVSLIDTDKNGEISTAELQKAMDDMRQKMRDFGGVGRRGGWRGGDDTGSADPAAKP
jgi:Ca2+-binding EF-hand superfamily protein